MITLVMIVKNEGHVLARALESAVNFADKVVIVDTGSTKEQEELMLEAIERVWPRSYAFERTKWVDFAHNRTEALRIAETIYPDSDWLFMMDADDYIINLTNVPLDPEMPAYQVMLWNADISYPRTQIFRADGTWHYEGVVHEYAERDRPYAQLPLYPITIASTREGARNQTDDKYERDAELLINALNDPDTPKHLRPRYTFYLAQSYDAMDNTDRALAWYDARVMISAGYTEERYVSLLRMAKIIYKLAADKKDADMLATLEQYAHTGQQFCPNRRELVAYAMWRYNEAGMYNRSLRLFAKYPPVKMPIGLFVEPETYSWLMLDRAAVASYYCGDYKVALTLGLSAMKGHPNMPLDLRRMADNLRFSVDKL